MKEHELFVDSGAVYSVVPKNMLISLGIKPASFEKLILAKLEGSEGLSQWC
jgi:hypothetical protein